jgi:hypothetical protein
MDTMRSDSVGVIGLPKSRDHKRHVRDTLLLIDGVFLAVVGGVQVTFELLSYYAGAGPLGDIFDQSPYTIGWVENHGLALLIGLLLLTVAVRDGRRFWHGFALAVHFLLALANVMFWSGFVAFDLVPLGIAATAAHVGFIAAHAIWLRSSSRRG